LRMARRLLDRQLVGVILLPMQLLGFTFLLLFLRKLATVLARQDLKRLVDTIFGLAIGTVLSFGLLAAEAFLKIGLLKGAPRPVGFALLALPAVLFVLAVAAYVILLGRMASAAADFAKYLAQADDSSAMTSEIAAN